MLHKYKLTSAWATVTIVLDQITKLWVHNAMEPWTGKEIIPGLFNLVYVLNKGAAWGFLDDDHINWQRPLFIIISLAAVAVITYMLLLTKEHDKWMISGLGMIAGGAIGNAIDRIWLGSVIDFLDFYVDAYHWPAFNVADSALTVGAGCIILSTLLNRKKAQG
ncbi:MULTISPECIES: signal peptidase II [unclassified Pseudodesulfovibrio]|uniref:signal peptidase II n=1 Tax=unclassified Pseudodesulfovibrio TaxID=2661612 RepID=UPI000FEB9DAB|nr:MULTISPECIES: signal peptidase II [unclassified Pseudodesulfovibrio]MCJ2163778.1 signal peptidase II [Pseudodesulfovibrio sp. S3-i]RWU05973.1 signal peptidase II [Pseudodesulfovibrio sp. S3]